MFFIQNGHNCGLVSIFECGWCKNDANGSMFSVHNQQCKRQNENPGYCAFSMQIIVQNEALSHKQLHVSSMHFAFEHANQLARKHFKTYFFTQSTVFISFALKTSNGFAVFWTSKIPVPQFWRFLRDLNEKHRMD